MRVPFRCAVHLSFLTVAAVLVCAGDRAVGADISPATYGSNTTLVDGDNWSSGTVTISSGVVVDVPTGATVTYDATANRTMNGSGTFLVQSGGIFAASGTNSDGDNIQLQGTLVFENQGTINFTNATDFDVTSTATLINSGLILKSAAGSAGEPSYVFRGGADAFLNTGTIQVVAGTLNIAGGTSTGGTFDVNGGALEIEGYWAELTGVSDVESGARFSFGNKNPAGTSGGQFTAAAATTVINVTGDGIDWRVASDTSTSTINTNGNVVDNQGIMYVRGIDATRALTGGGTFTNSGSFYFAQGTISVDAGTTFSNTGTLEIQPGSTKKFTGTGNILNGVGGTVNFNGGTTTTFDNAFHNQGTANIVSGDVTFAGSSGFTNDAGGELYLQSTANLIVNTSLINNGTAYFAETGNKTISGSAAFVNNGSFIHSDTSGTDNLQLSGTGGFENNGTFDFQAGGDINTQSSTVTFTNNGVFLRSGSTGDHAFVFGNGSFVNADGGEVRSTAGELVIALDNSVSDAGSSWNALGGTIQIGGSWTGTFNGNGTSAVFVGTHGNGTVGKQDLVVGAAGITMNITGYGFVQRSQTIDTDGNVFTNTGVFTFSTTTAKSISGGGTFQNTGTGQMTLAGTVLTLDATDLTNEATFTISGAVTLDGTGELINASAGTLSWDSASGSSTLTLNAAIRNQGTLDVASGNTHNVAGSGTFENAAGGTMTWSDGTLQLTNDLVNNGTFVYLAGDDSLAGSGTFVNNGTFQHATTNSADNITGSSSGTFLNNGLFDFTGVGDFQLNDNYTFTNVGTVLRSSTASNESLFFNFSGNGIGGTFDNQGTVEVTGGQLEFRASGGFDPVVVTQVSGTTLTGGTWIVDASGSGSAELDLQPATSGILTLGADATVKLVGSGSTFSQINGLTTVDGAFYVGGTRSFSLASGFTVSSTGILGGDGTYVGDATISGTLAPGDEGLAGILTFESIVDLTDGTLQIDIDGPTVGTEYDQLLFSGTGPHELILSGTTLDLDVTYFPSVADEFVIVSGFDTLTGIFEGLPDGSTFQQDGVGFYIHYNADSITLNAVPEPSTLVLLTLGFLTLGSWTLARRRRQAA